MLELLEHSAPSVTRVAVLRNAATASRPSHFAAIQAVAPSLRVEVNPVDVRDASERRRRLLARSERRADRDGEPCHSASSGTNRFAGGAA